MKRLLTAVTGLVLMAAASGCCCDWCNWSCCQPCCRPCGGGGCSPYGSPPAGAYLNPGTTTSALPATYYGAPVATAAVPVESLPTY